MMIQIVCCVLYESLKLCDYNPFCNTTDLLSITTLIFIESILNHTNL